VPDWPSDAGVPLCFSGAGLDRADGLLQDRQWLDRQLHQGDTRFLLVWHDCIVVDESWNLYLTDEPEVLQNPGETPLFLGLRPEGALFAVDLSALDETLIGGALVGARLVELRRAMVDMPMEQAAIAGYGCMLLRWHRHNRFCGRCGAPSASNNGGHSRRCQAPACGRELFPRIDPAVIMLVEQAPRDGLPARCLLGHHRRMEAGRFSTLAGFVEPGESLEEAVRREVMEEVGIEVGAVSYQGSQPWPFPSSLMLGFRARAASEVIEVDGREIDQADWFSAEQLRAGGEWGRAGDADLSLPGCWSIARHLIDGWLAEQP